MLILILVKEQLNRAEKEHKLELKRINEAKEEAETNAKEKIDKVSNERNALKEVHLF